MQRLYDTNPLADKIKALISKALVRVLIISTTFFPSCLYSGELPDLGNSASAILTPAQELELGSSIMKELSQAQVISHDAYVTQYLQGLGYRLLATQGQAQGAYHFFVVKDPTINAFALPGGFVGVNTGLILASESESELAGVLAHEVAHVQQKHMARMYEHMGRLRLSTIAGMLAAALLATQNSQAASGAMAATLAGSQQVLINYTRDHEKEADYVGINALKKAGFDPNGMPAFFHRMSQETRYYGNHLPEYLMTHPLTESRLMEAQARASSFPYKQIPDSLQYHLVQARVLADTFSTPQEASEFFSKRLAKGNYRSRTGTLYGYVISLLDANKPQQAKPYLDELIQSTPNQPLFQLAYAQMEMAMQETDKALSRLASTLENHPNNYAVTYTYCEWLIKVGNANKAIAILKNQVARKTAYSNFWYLLSQAYVKTNNPLQAHLAQAHFLKMQGDLSGAVIQLRMAKKVSTLNAQEQRQIDAELKDIQSKMDPKQAKL
ncbi:MAG: M48 family metallopeptidase [Proteobacteria bacterium]|nr:M48 family metallopeptidase [Pseudomonadota bacterium]